MLIAKRKLQRKGGGHVPLTGWEGLLDSNLRCYAVEGEALSTSRKAIQYFVGFVLHEHR